MQVYFQDLFDSYSKQTSKIDVLLGEIRSSGKEKITHVYVCLCVCVCGGGGLHVTVTIFYSPQAPMKRVWNPLLPQINITEQCESLCTRQINFENPPKPTLGFDSGAECLLTR